MKVFTAEGISLVEAPAWRTSPWRNGGGVTHTIAAWPAADPHDPPGIRLSVADIEHAGPFSRFAGLDRWLAVLDDGGAPLRLALPAGPLALPTGAAAAFSGDDPVDAAPAGAAPTRVFNLILARDLPRRADYLAAAEPAPTTSPPGIVALFAPPAAPVTATVAGRDLTIPPLATAILTSRTPATVHVRSAPAVRVWIGAVAALAFTLAACGSRQVKAFPSELRAAAPALQQTGRAEIQSIDDGRFTVRATTQIEVAEPAGDALLVRRVTIAELVDGCPAPGTPSPRCLADRVVDREMVVGEKRTRNVGGAITSVVAAGAGLALVGGCLAECENKDIALGAGLVIAGAGLFLLLAMSLR